MFPRRSQIWWCSLLFVVGCGYTLNHRLKPAFRSGKPIFVPVFDNNTDETGTEVVFTNALLRELRSRSQPEVSPQPEGALELKGTVERIEYGPSAISDAGTLSGLPSYRRIPAEFGVTVGLVFVLRDPEKEEVLWTRRFSGFRRINAVIDRTFDAQAPSSVGLLNQSLIESMYPEIARQIMRDLHDEMLELF